VATKQELTNVVWQAATAIRNEHRDVKTYIEYTAILLFFKFYDDVYDSLPTDIQGLIPERYRWSTLKALDPRSFEGYHPEVRNRLRDFFGNKRWRDQARGHFGVIFENFGFDIKHDEVLGRALRQLDKIDFTTIDYDAKGAIYEFLISKMSEAGVKGEFFTPRPVVNMIIDVLQPRFGMRVWDPAAGTGGFLARAWEEMLADLKVRCSDERSAEYQAGLRQLRENSIYGNETESVSARLARMNMILKGDGHSAIHEFNSLDQQTYTLPTLTLRDDEVDNPYPAILADDGFDLIMANPPYGGSQAVSDLGGYFKTWTRTAKPESNFLQLMMHALKPGGRCGVLMPEGVLFRSVDSPIRRRLLREFDLQGVVGLFKGIFEFADVKACVLFFRKPEKGKRWEGTQRVWIADTRTFDEVAAVPSIFGKPAEVDFARFVSVDEIKTRRHNLRPMLYLKRSLVSDSVSTVPFAQLFEPVRDRITLEDETVYKQVTVKLYSKGAILRQELRGAEIKTKRQMGARAGDLIASKIDARNGALAIIPDELDGAIATSDFPLFRPRDEEVNRSLLHFCLEFGPYAEMLQSLAQGTTNRQRVTLDDILELPYPLLSPEQLAPVLRRLEQQEQVLRTAEVLSAGYRKLNWLDDSLFQFSESSLLATSFEPLVENATDYVDPTSQPEAIWKVYGVSNEEGIRIGQTKIGIEFKVGRKYKRLIKGALAYNPQRVNVGSVGLVTETDEQSIISPYYVIFTCKPDLDRRFAYYLIKSPYFRRLIDETAIGAVRHELFLSLFTNIEVPIPKLEVQQQVVKAVESQLVDYEGVRRLKEQAEKTMRRIVQGLFGLSDGELEL
jgi:type I restriction enzyme M protein